MGNFSNYWDLYTLFTKIKNKIKSVSDSIPTKLSDLTADATHRLVTDTEKSTWNGINKFNNNMIGALNAYTNNGVRTIYQSVMAYINGLSASSKPRGFVQFLITYNANAMPSDLPSHAKWNYAWGEVYFRHDASYEDAAIILHPYTDDSMIIKQVLNSEEKTWQTVFTDKNTGLSPSDVRTQLDAKVPICKATVDLSSLDQNTYYPVTGDKLNTLSDKTMRPVRICVNVWLNSGTKPSWSTHGSGFSVTLDVLVQGNGWGSQTQTCHVLVDTFSFVSGDISPCAYTQMVTASIPVIWCRGGGKYHIYTDYDTNWTVRTSSYTASGDTISPTTTKPTNAMWAVNGYFGGSADSAYRVKDSNNGRNLAVRWGGNSLSTAAHIAAFNTAGTEIAPMSLATLESLLNTGTKLYMHSIRVYLNAYDLYISAGGTRYKSSTKEYCCGKYIGYGSTVVTGPIYSGMFFIKDGDYAGESVWGPSFSIISTSSSRITTLTQLHNLSVKIPASSREYNYNAKDECVFVCVSSGGTLVLEGYDNYDGDLIDPNVFVTKYSFGFSDAMVSSLSDTVTAL